MNTPLVSVLIPCFNAERYIGDTLESVFRQTWSAIEIVVVDDGSTDGSIHEIKRFQCSQLTVLSQQHQGQTTALNKCISHSVGAFIQFLDADDLLSPDKIALQMRRLIDRPDCVATAEWGRFYTNPEDTRFDAEPVWRDLDPLDWLALSRAEGLGMMFPALWLIPRPLVDRVGPWRQDLTLNNDAEYFTRLLLDSKHVLFCERARAYYRSGIPRSLGALKSPAAWASQFKVIELCECRVLARENSERMRRAFSLSWQHLAHGAYPYDPALAERALARAHSLHSVRIMPAGGLRFQWLSRIIGWRAARRLQIASGRK
jgi:glycosyltransferase involved in cell wall biosynthesis